MFAFWRQQPEGLTEAPVRRSFYTPRDWLAGGLTTLLAFAVYLATLAPGITLKDSGELATAAYHFGVPHPPGYPLWTLLGWFWTRLFPFGNIAWRLGVFSALASALAAGLAALLIAKSSRVMLVRLGLLERLRQPGEGEWLIFTGAMAGGLILAGSVVLWSQAVVVEACGLQALCLMLVLNGLFRWSFDPARRWRLYVAAWLWGVGLTTQQTLALLCLALPLFVLFTDRKLGRDLLLPVLVGIVVGVAVLALRSGSLFYQGVFPMLVLLALGGGAALWCSWLWREERKVMTCWRQVLAVYGAVLLGLMFYLYLPVASATNPPMNWGYTRSWDGFLQHVTRGEYEQVQAARSPLQFWVQLNMFLGDLAVEFGIVYALIGLLVWLFVREMGAQSWDWLRFLLVSFLSVGLGFLFFSNPSLEKQKEFTERVFFLPGHCIYALWVGYGLVLGGVYSCARWPRFQRAVLPITALVAVLPSASLIRHWGSCGQRGHDFGTEFGYRMFRPEGDYPEMDHGAILFAGTDGGRAIATYMAFVESQVSPGQRLRPNGNFDRRDVAVITQNALVSPHYRNYIRDHYTKARPDPSLRETLAGRPAWQNGVLAVWSYGLGRELAYPSTTLWLPGEDDVQAVWQQYFAQTGTSPPGASDHVDLGGGKVRGQGLSSVIAVNAILSRLIFERNRDTHTMYAEESYVLPWMYDYAEPFGLILRLNAEPAPLLDQRVLGRDRRYWDQLTNQLRSDPNYQQDQTAQRTFAKLRATIAGLYAYRGLMVEAEYAFRQALRLCPESFEASYRLSQLYAGLNRLDDAVVVLLDYQKWDRYNPRVQESLVNLRRVQEQLAASRQPAIQINELPKPPR